MSDDLTELFEEETKVEDKAEESQEENDPKPEAEKAPEADEETKVEKVAETTAAESEEDKAFKAMALDERRKRQALQAELDQISAKQTEKPDAIEDPEGALNHLSDQFTSALVANRIVMSQEFMRDLKDDYPEMEAKFAEMAEQNPALSEQLRAHPMPAKFAYTTAKEAVELESFKSMNKEEWEAKKTEEIRQKILKEMEDGDQLGQEKEAAKSKAEIPSLAKSGSSGVESVTEQALEEVFDT